MRYRALKHFCIGPATYGLNISADNYVSEGIRFLRTTDIAVDGSVSTNARPVFLPADVVPSKYILQDGDILLSRSGTLGRSMLFSAANAPASFAGYLVRFRPSSDSFPPYLAYCAQSHLLQDAVRADAVESTIGNFNAEKYANIRLPYWPMTTQRAIANYLDRETARIDALVTARWELAALIEERMNSFRSEHVLRGCDPIVGVGSPPSEWQIRNLSAVITLQRGHDLLRSGAMEQRR